jgi:hypothetical protein
MSYSALIRNFWTRIIYGAEDTLAKVEDDVQIQQALEGAVTYVAEFKPTGFQTSILNQGQEITIDTLSFELNASGNYDFRPVFTGVIDPRNAAAAPNSVTVTAVGNLRKLRKTRQTDYDMTGKTDTQVVKDILTFCGIDFVEANIAGDGYVLGQIVPLKWKKGQSGFEVLSELDTVFGYATIELGDGTVVRFPYSKIPSEYSDTIYGTSGTIKNYRAGTVGLTFYDDERSLGSMDEIKNHWTVNGVSWTGAEGAADEGCDYQIYAEASAENAMLGTGVYQHDELSSDFIQSTALAYKIAARLMRTYNRTPDTVRIEGGNDPKVGVGHLIGVRDSAYGMQLPTTQRYLVTNTVRVGDLMTIDVVGGAPGDEGTITSWVKKCCGTQKEDGTCDETAGDSSGDNTPDIPDIPDTGECDPLTNVNCIPGVDTETDGTNFIDPLVGCTTDGAFFQCDPASEDYDECSSFQLSTCEGITGIIDVCSHADSGTHWWKRTEIEMGDTYLCSCTVRVPWRTASGVPYFRKVGNDIDAVANVDSPSPVILRWNEEIDPDLQTVSTDRAVGTPAVHSISGVVTFNQPGALLSVGFVSIDNGTPTLMRGTLYADPGQHIVVVAGTDRDIGMSITTELESGILLGDAPPNTSKGGFIRNNGGYVDSSPVPLGQQCAFTFSFDMTAHNGWGRTTGTSCVGGGHIEHNDYLQEGSPLPGEPTDTPSPITLCTANHPQGHWFEVSLTSSNPGDFDAPAVILEGVVVGYDTCEGNPDYVQDVEDATV